MNEKDVSDRSKSLMEESTKEAHKKTIGYLSKQYWGIERDGCRGEPAVFTPLFDEARDAAQEIAQPCWPVKYAAIYYTYEGKYYITGPWRMDCTQEVFEVMSDSLIDRMYKLGAYDMFYSGMLD